MQPWRAKATREVQYVAFGAYKRGRLATVAAVLALLAVPSSSSAASQMITSSGPLENISVLDTLGCQIFYSGATPAGQFFDGSACGTVLDVGGTAYSFEASNVDPPANPYFDTLFTRQSQSPVTGSGTELDPFKVVTVVDAGATGLRITQTDTYVVGKETLRTDIEVQNTGAAEQSATLYRFGDCFIGTISGPERDTSAGVGTPGGGGACVQPPGDPNAPFTLELFPLSPGSNFGAGIYANSGQRIEDGLPLADLASPPPSAPDEDSYVGLSWQITVPAGGSVSRSLLTTASADAELPLIATKGANSPTTAAGGQNGYSIAIQNRSDNEVTLASITDVLPSGFSYRPGTTSGATTSEPGVDGQALTYGGPFNIPASANVGLGFGVNVPSAPGDYDNSVSGDGGNTTVVPATARVTVTPGPPCGGLNATLTGTEAGETLQGTALPDVVAALGGNDSVLGAGGGDRACGGGGSDRLNGGIGKDTIFGQLGTDTLVGGKSRDRLVGGAKRDVLRGGAGGDILIGGAGKDRCIGSAGKDVERGC